MTDCFLSHRADTVVAGVVPLLPRKDGGDEEDSVSEIGTAARVLKVLKMRRSGVSAFAVVLEGICRIRLAPPPLDEPAKVCV